MTEEMSKLLGGETDYFSSKIGWKIHYIKKISK